MDSLIVDDKSDIRNVPKNLIKELISTYKSHPALWQIKNKDLYGNRVLKLKGHRALVNVWRKYDENADIRMVKNKIQSLRGTFRKELKKIKNSWKSGSGPEDIYKSQLWYFSLMTFLTDHEQLTRTVDHLDEPELKQEAETCQDTDDDDDDDRTANDEMSATNTTPDILYDDKYVPAKKKRKIIEEKRKFIKAGTGLHRNMGDNERVNDIFGKFISMKLDKISDAEQRMYAESLITKVANYAILNKLTEFTDVVGNYTLVRETNNDLGNYSSSTSVSTEQ